MTGPSSKKTRNFDGGGVWNRSPLSFCIFLMGVYSFHFFGIVLIKEDSFPVGVVLFFFLQAQRSISSLVLYSRKYMTMDLGMALLGLGSSDLWQRYIPRLRCRSDSSVLIHFSRNSYRLAPLEDPCTRMLFLLERASKSVSLACI